MFKKILCYLLVLSTSMIEAQVIINEFDSDNPSTDDKEFIELKSATPNFSLNGYVLVFFNGTGSLADKSYYTISLNGLTTDVNGLVLIGNNLVSPVPERIFTNSSIQNGPDGVGLYLGSTSDFPAGTTATTVNLIDALVHSNNNTLVPSLQTLLGVATQVNENANGSGTTQSIQRKSDGTWEVKAPTPGVNNDGSGFIYNGITITVNTNHKNEGDSFSITFTSDSVVSSALNFTFSLNNSGFTIADFTGNTSVSIPAGSNSFSTTITLTDDTLDEGDEVLKIKFGALPSGFNRRNDNIEIRVVDNDFTTLPFGTPLNPTYGNVSSTAPAGYYDSLEGLSGAALKQALQNIIANPAVVRAHNYGDVTDILKVADQNPLNSNQVWLMYVETPRAKLDFQTTSSNVGSWNREHIYPQSRGGFANATDDIPDGINVWLPTNADDIATGHGDAHHIRAEDGPENTSRSNRDYGLTGYNGPVGNQGSWKGDVARSVFYMAVRYNALSVVNGDIPDTTVGQLGDLASLLTWNHTDPSDDFEMNRNNYIYTWQYNRNPFIDYPTLADYIWGTNAGQPWYASLSTNENTAVSISIYPNPTSERFTVYGMDSEATLVLFNSLGMKVYEQEFSGETTFEPQVAPGIYLINISKNNQSITKKIIIK
ncbi:MAG: ribonuclease [Flavobacterium sp.]|uniref:endonuclease n=1 Tax=Flavobacterium sp. TaxID=239 RepID=UPI0025B8B0E6|nr:endonuclease [Flavobacterium sp.]MBA4135010.1 ribonuclease [Flavobacterium sp.]